MKRTLWSFEPDEDVKEMMEKVIIKEAGRDKRNQRGWRTRILNNMVRAHYSKTKKGA